MRKRLERFGEVEIVFETNGFGVDAVKETGSGFTSTNPDIGVALYRGTNLGFVYS